MRRREKPALTSKKACSPKKWSDCARRISSGFEETNCDDGNDSEYYDEEDDMTDKQSFNLLLLDDAIPKFTGTDKTYTASKWTQDVDDNAEIFCLTPQQKLLIARRSLTGTAAMWLRTEKPFKTYDELKTAIHKEFPDTTNTKEIHELMARRKKRKDETCYAYMLEMKELGKRGRLADYVAIQYIIDGIVDHEANKTLLYGASTYPELKEKFKLYESYKNNLRKNHNEQTRKTRFDAPSQSHASNTSSGEKHYMAKRCYNCGEMNHVSSMCPKQSRKCFNCNNFGHISMECPEKKMDGGPRIIPKSDTSKPERTRSLSSGNIRNTSGTGSALHGSGKQAFFNTTALNDGGATSSDVQSDQLHDEVFFVSSDVNYSVNVTHEVSAADIKALVSSAVICSDGDKNGKMASKTTNGGHTFDVNKANFGTYECEVTKSKHHDVGNRKLKPVKIVKMYNKTTNALIDSGSDVNLVSDEFCDEFGTLQCDKNMDNITLCGLGGAKVKSIGTITTALLIDERLYDAVLFYVVPKTCMPFKIILGNDFLKNVTMFMSGSTVWLRPRDDEWLDCMLGEYDGTSVPSTDHIKDPEIREEVKQLVETYKPHQVKEAPIEMKIILKDDIPVVQRPRRISLKEQHEVEEQVAEWLDKGIIRQKMSRRD
ncbi:uncharacterized protein [Choristoneura fumiferana]|uniref:uncharacterized protein n=1 Tax=Choristoneura fumiferana TaxID=7141 RepID=UPI003D1565B5